MAEREPDGRLRVFVSSTMDDLVNEREAICRRLREFNFEPVNAENWLPSGQNSWERIRSKIHSSDLCVLLLGERYGWIPTAGWGADLAKSVTHLEFDEASKVGLTILPFAKELKDGTDHASEEAKKRDGFRKEVLDWAKYFRGPQFRNCFELAEQVGAAVIELISQQYQRGLIEKRAAARLQQATPAAPVAPGRAIALPADLMDAVRGRRAVILAGAGISLAAGLPSASAFALRLAQAADAAGTKLEESVVGAAFTNVATDLDLLYGRPFLVDAIRPLMIPPQGITPTLAHRAALKLFPTVVTTNFDNLFERALASTGDARATVEDELPEARLVEPVLVKFHGSFERPQTLILSEREVLGIDRTRKNLWNALVALLRERPLLVVGSSLHDASLVRLCLDVGGDLRGWFVGPSLSSAVIRRLAQWKLQAIDADADTFFDALTLALGSQPV
jgi:hypothetical protein